MNSPEIQRIRQDMARCKQRIAEIRAGTRGVHPGQWDTLRTGEHGAGLAHDRQLQAQQTALQRLELEYVNAMLPIWGPARVISALEPALPAAK